MSWIVWTWPLVGALIGWLTNIVAIRMIFRPREPVRLPFVSVSLQGLLPRRRAELARSVGETVERHLLSADKLMDRLNLPALKQELVRSVTEHVEARLDQQMPRFVPSGLKAAIEAYVSEFVRREAAVLVERVVGDAQERLRSNLQLGQIVEEKILGLDLDELEALVWKLAQREFRHIEWLGALLGFLIGVVQAAVFTVFPVS